LLVNSQGLLLAETAMLAALGEAAADTLASELGEVFGGVPRLVTTWRPVAPGTDGGVTVAGTLAGVTGAAVVIAVGALVLRLSAGLGAVVLAAAIVGLIVDSLLGAIIERRGWMNNDAVNFCSTLAAAALALLLGRRVL
jgi:uncharacterized protein (TIGR00297 family)